jgi:hypothetical protein
VLWSLNGFRARPSAHNQHSRDFVPPLATYRPTEISAAGVSHASEPNGFFALLRAAETSENCLLQWVVTSGLRFLAPSSGMP